VAVSPKLLSRRDDGRSYGLHGFMIDAVMGDTMGKLAFRRWVVRVSRCIVARADGSLLD